MRAFSLLKRVAMSVVLVPVALSPAIVGATKWSAFSEPRERSSAGAVYAKVILPMKESAKENHPVVEAWIGKNLRKRGETDLRAVTNWIRLPDGKNEVAPVWDAVVDGKGWGCPVGGRILERTTAGKVKVSLTGWTPFGGDIKGGTLPDEIGSRKIAVVGGRNEGFKAYVALVVAPPSVDASSKSTQSIKSPVDPTQ